VLGGFEARGLAHLKKLIAMRKRPDKLLLDGDGAAWLDKQAVMAMDDEVGAASAGRAEYGDAAGHGLKDDEAEAFGDGRQRDEVAAFHIRRELGIRKSSADLDVDGLETAKKLTVDRSTRVEDELG